MGDLTANFSLSEFAQREPYRPVPTEYRQNVLRLAEQLQSLRDVVGRIVITSSYRTEAHNASLPGSSSTSQHLTAKAAGFVVPGVPQSEVYCTILRLIPHVMDEGGLGWYSAAGHIHYDVRGFKRRWNNTDGPLPYCPPVAPRPPWVEEDEDMAIVLVKTAGSSKVLRTDGVSSWHVPDMDVLRQLQALGDDAPVNIPKELFQALWETRHLG